MANDVESVPRRLYLLPAATFALGTGAFVFAAQLETLAADLRVSAAAAGQLQTAYLIAAAALGPPLAALAAKRSPSRLLLVILVTAALLNVLSMIAHQYSVLLLLRAMLGATAALGGPMAAILAARMVPPERRGAALALIMGGMTSAFLLGVPLGGAIGGWFGWRATFGFAASVAGFAAVAIAFLPQGNGAVPDGAASPLFLVRRLWPLYATTLLTFGAALSVSTYIAPVLRSAIGIVGAPVAFYQAAGGLGCIVGLAIGARVGGSPAGGAVVASCMVIVAACASTQAALLLDGPHAGIAARLAMALTLLISSAALFTMLPILQVRIIDSAVDAAALALTVNASATALGQGLGAAAGGYVLTQAGLSFVPIVSIGLTVAALGFWVLSDVSWRRRPGLIG